MEREITVDEWIVHFISEPQKREVAVKFLEKVHQKCDKLVTLRGGPLDQKIWKMAKSSQDWDIGGKRLVKWFMREFRLSSKFRALEELDMEPLPGDLERETPEDDLYLVKTAISTLDRLIVTTDGGLKERLSSRSELTVCFFDEFFKVYNC
ncbi:MAG: hypothetical protein AOA66_0442 [Candidatus Bathyarchaeota archaeon BA2]|nr:MAG: hypothetical protein AOA66_0442 [Candidatus Bathyarchaeota archaeon BA2]